MDSKSKSGDKVQIPSKGGLGAQIHFSHWGLGQQPTMKHRNRREREVMVSQMEAKEPLQSHSQGRGAPVGTPLFEYI